MPSRDSLLSALIVIGMSTVIAIGFVAAAFFYAASDALTFYFKVFAYTFVVITTVFGFILILSE